jgi:hypothetical protein
MRVLVCGGEFFDDWQFLEDTLMEIWDEQPNRNNPFVICEGGRKGAEFLARAWAVHVGKSWPSVSFQEVPEPKYAKYKRTRDQQRHAVNRLIHQTRPDLIVAFPGYARRRQILERAKQKNIAVWEVGDHE